MKQASTGTISGCLVWVIACAVISTCVLPFSIAIGAGTSVTDIAIQQMGSVLCPEGTTPSKRTFATTTTDEFGNRQPSTGYVLQCVNSDGTVVSEDPVGYAFLWIGVFLVVGLVVSSMLAFVFAAPAGVLIARLMNRNKGRLLRR